MAKCYKVHLERDAQMGYFMGFPEGGEGMASWRGCDYKNISEMGQEKAQEELFKELLHLIGGMRMTLGVIQEGPPPCTLSLFIPIGGMNAFYDKRQSKANIMLSERNKAERYMKEVTKSEGVKTD